MPVLLRVSVLLLALLPAVACTRAGGSCKGSGYVCEDDAAAMECREGTWVSLPCRGPAGCSVTSGTVACQLPDGGDGTCQTQVVTCDTSRSEVGDACASSAEGRGLCSTDGKALLECRRGEVVQTARCASCFTSGGRVVCEPGDAGT